MMKSGLGDSPLFKDGSGPKAVIADRHPLTDAQPDGNPSTNSENNDAPTQSVQSDSMTPSNHGTRLPVVDDALIQVIRKRLLAVGKEAGTIRMTEEEKQALNEIVYKFRLAKIKVSENEITRIAINYIVEDNAANRKQSILARTIKALRE